MLRFFARLVGIWLMAAALIVAVVDGAKSIAASRLVTTPVLETWATLAALAAPGAEPAEPMVLPWPLDILLAWLLAVPSVAVLAALATLFLVAGKKRRRFSLGREYAT